MESIVVMLVFTAFLVIVLYKMDANEKAEKSNQESTYRAGFVDGIMWGRADQKTYEDESTSSSTEITKRRR